MSKVYLSRTLPTSPYDRRVFRDTPRGTQNLGLVGTRAGKVLWMDGKKDAVELSGADVRGWETQISNIMEQE